jgi:hypothetical protein
VTIGNTHGLGPVIIRAIADAHGATLTVRTRPEGGLRIEVTFPAGRHRRRAPAGTDAGLPGLAEVGTLVRPPVSS